MSTLAALRCFHHPAREAVARCPECRRYFCRECISEHEGRVVCASCLAKLLATSQARTNRFALPVRLCLALIGLATSWAFFELLGRTLIRIPASFHEGAVWERFLD